MLSLLATGLAILWLSGYFNRPGQAVAILGREHIQWGPPPQYNSRPPTSGPHYANQIADWGLHEQKIEDPLQVATLEQGAVIIHYEPEKHPVLPDPIRDQLRKLVKRLRAEPRYCKLVLAPYPNLGTKIALTAWGRIDRFDTYDEARILRFIDAYIDQGPEDAPCL
jgi:hypothetical protein